MCNTNVLASSSPKYNICSQFHFNFLVFRLAKCKAHTVSLENWDGEFEYHFRLGCMSAVASVVCLLSCIGRFLTIDHFPF
jgi:hypothetical protein